MILGSTFPEKLVFQDGKVGTACPDSPISVLIKPDKDFRGNKKWSAKIFAPFWSSGGKRGFFEPKN